ncbi:MAG: universal stress protein [Acidobacteriia bacterium]|nr:universal stress protein [Terriglobia bacterium]
MSPFGLRTILCPVDFSDLSALALKYAVDFRKCSGGDLLILFANPFLPPPQLTGPQIDQLAEAWNESKRSTEQYLASFVEKQLGEAPTGIELIVVESPPVNAIVETAGLRTVDLIVMGTHGQGGETRMLLGSVAERVLRESGCPVLTVRLKKEKTKTPAAIRNILVPINFSVVSRMALVSAGRIAECFGATVSVLRAIEPFEEPCNEADEMTRLQAWVPPEIRKKCEIQEFVIKGEGAERIVSFAEEEKIDLIVLGAQHRKFFDSTIVGTTTLRVVRHAPCPVFTLIRK